MELNKKKRKKSFVSPAVQATIVHFFPGAIPFFVLGLLYYKVALLLYVASRWRRRNRKLIIQHGSDTF